MPSKRQLYPDNGRKVLVVLFASNEIQRYGLRDTLSGMLGVVVEWVTTCIPSTVDCLTTSGVVGVLTEVEVAIAVQAHAPQARIIVVGPDDQLALARAVDAGIRGYVVAPPTAAELTVAIHAVAQGRSMFIGGRDASVGNLARARIRIWRARLSRRELDVFTPLASGENTQQIAHSLSLDQRTVRTHATSLKKKLAVRDRYELTILAKDAVLMTERDSAKH